MSTLWIIFVFLSTFAKGSLSTDSYNALQDDGIQYRLPNATKPETYDIYISTSVHNQNFTFEGSVSIVILVTEDTSSITLHSHRLHTIHGVSLLQEEGRVEIPLTGSTYDDNNNFLTIPLVSGVLERDRRYVLNIVFDSTLQDDPRGFYKSSYVDDSGNVRYLATTQLGMTDARHAFPCFDEARYRANFSIRIRHGSNYHAVSNMPIDNTADDGSGMTTTTFLTTPLAPTYILAYTISDFVYASNGNSGTDSIPIRTYARSNAIHGASYSVEVGEKLLMAYDDYLGVKFALPKMDQVAVADFPFSAMENWGMVVYKEPVLLLFPNSTHATKTRITTIIAHEFAHQWFGNLVTPKWWTWTWLSEGFSTLFEHLATNWVFPEWNINDYYVYNTLQNVFQSDAEDSTRPMSTYAESPAAILDVLDSVTYAKASCVLRMIMHAITEDVFKSGLRNYFRERAYLAADENDLFDAMAESILANVPSANRVDITAIMSSWTQQKGYPFLTITRNYDTGSISVRQDRYQSYIPAQMDRSLWWIPLNYASATSYDFTNTTAQRWLSNVDRSTTITQTNEWTADDWVIFNKRETGYFRVLYDAQNYKIITRELVEGDLSKIHLTSRSQLVDDALNFAKTGRLPYSVVFELIGYLEKEREFVPWASAFRGLEFVHRIMAGSASYEHLRTFTLNLVDGLFDYIGIKDLGDNEPHFNKDLRILATNWACRLGSINCIEKTNAELRQNWDNIHSNMRPTIYCNGLRANGDNDFSSLMIILYDTVDSTERNNILAALGCSSNEAQLKVYIQTSLGNNYLSAAENYQVFTAVMENGELGLNVALDFLDNYLAEAVVAYGNTNMNNAIIATANKIVGSDREQRFIPILQRALPSGQISVQSYNESLKIVEDNKNWLTNHQGSIDNWLNDFYKSSGNTVAAGMLSVLVVLASCFRYI
ncbi:aminopeptidase N-like [Bradysia coprophila]|uniref:aminopeptidase N-like n=1 Tax=Bradysia coprophila TaxID=38358 RepID=UPI00187DC03E|nr:aminopeptidase N-like [Bradysia coprophila]